MGGACSRVRSSERQKIVNDVPPDYKEVVAPPIPEKKEPIAVRIANTRKQNVLDFKALIEENVDYLENKILEATKNGDSIYIVSKEKFHPANEADILKSLNVALHSGCSHDGIERLLRQLFPGVDISVGNNITFTWPKVQKMSKKHKTKSFPSADGEGPITNAEYEIQYNI